MYYVASLTKVLATAPAVMLLVERGRVKVDDPVSAHLPEFNREGREAITLRHLLTHTSGLRPGLGLRPEWTGYEGAIQRAVAEEPEAAPNARFRYSDITFLSCSGRSSGAWQACHSTGSARRTCMPRCA